MITTIRQKLYEGTGLKPMFDPIRPLTQVPRPAVVDASFDITCLTAAYYGDLPEAALAVRRFLAEAVDTVVVETNYLARVIAEATETVQPMVAPYGLSLTPKQTEWEKITVVVLHHDLHTIWHNQSHCCQEVVRRAAAHFKVVTYDKPWFGGVSEAIPNLEEFAAKCDVLLLTSNPHFATGMAIPLSVMSTGTALLI